MNEQTKLKYLVTVSVTALALAAGSAVAQEAPPPDGTAAPAVEGQAPATPADGAATPADAAAPAGQELPPVEVIQTEPTPQPAPQQQAQPQPQPSSPPPVQQAQPAPQQPAPQPQAQPAPQTFDPGPDVADLPPQGPVGSNPLYGAPGSAGAAARAQQGATSPINPRQITPTNLSGFSKGASNISPDLLRERRDRTTNEALRRVPGLTIISDDGNAHHGGVGIRGGAPRRSRKVLMMEDGHTLNLALWLDASVHFIPPFDRIESIEVIRGGSIVHGPNNNFGIVNLRNLSVWGEDEVVVSGALGWTDNGPNDRKGASNRRHVHIRQSIGNVGLVASYSGANVEGAWNTEVLRYDDFYVALGFKGSNQDLVVNYSYAKQRDNYDESNLEVEGDDGDVDPFEPERQFGIFGHDKLAFAPGAFLNTYTGEIHRGQITHNLYIDQDTTLTSRLYAQEHRRDRYQIVSLEANPSTAGGDEVGLSPIFEDAGDGLFSVLLGEDSMFGRLRTFRHVGAETRLELANRTIFGVNQDIQAGIRYEYQEMTNRNFLGDNGVVLEDGDTDGLTIFERNLDADTISAFLQSELKLTRNFSVTPGVRFEWFKINRQTLVSGEEEGEAEELENDPECEEIAAGLDDCLEIEGINRTAFNESFNSANVLPGVSFAYKGLDRTTVYGGYHRGMTTPLYRNETIPGRDELGDNFELGIRSTAIRGVTFDLAGFYKKIQNYQFTQGFSVTGDKTFSRGDEVSVQGFEVFGRLDSNPFTGGPWNVFFEGNYTYNRTEFDKGVSEFAEDEDDDPVELSIAGNRAPEIPLHVAALTLGVQHKPLGGWAWDASVTYTYRGEFFTDEFETITSEEGESGLVPDIWLLSARANFQIGDRETYLWVSGTNLTNELYISDREDGLKPGQGRTFWAGFKHKF